MSTLWHDMEKREPTREDTDPQECVLVWHMYNGVMLYHYKQAISSDYIRYWMRCPEKPDEKTGNIIEE